MRGYSPKEVIFLPDFKKTLSSSKFNSTGSYDYVYVYGSKILEDVDFIMSYDSNGWGFNLSYPINSLIKRNLLNNPFKIWSDSPFVIIKNAYEKNIF